ncbi:alpha/beta fold hydrolase, partial [Streptomyces sp. NPDC057757]|uniref:alpha/beta fold hydrolase n=1 Tax=Streptomyces sp. NPDC057757 TaxID=3346241 RepID=UPI0036AFC705
LQERATGAAWRKLPNWYLIATEDRNIPPAAQRGMAARAKARTVSVHAPHAAAVTEPDAVSELIFRAAHAGRSAR